jgi:predicted nucleotidyltransferase component of viral defense system
LEEIKSWFTERQRRHTEVLKNLLIEIFKDNPRALVLKGGTALSLFHGSNRFSEDIDLSSSSMDNYVVIDDVLESIENRYNYRILNDWTSEIEQTGRFRRYFIRIIDNDGEVVETRIDYSIGKCEMEAVKRDLSNDYRMSKVDVMALEEILAEKVRALYTRQKGRDLYDLHYLSVTKRVEIRQKLIFYKFREDPKLKDVKYSFKTFEARVKGMKGNWGDLDGLVSNFEASAFDKVENEVLAAFRNV